jgi:hypothetical protein
MGSSDFARVSSAERIVSYIQHSFSSAECPAFGVGRRGIEIGGDAVVRGAEIDGEMERAEPHFSTRYPLPATRYFFTPMSDAKLTPMMQQYFEVDGQICFRRFQRFVRLVSQRESPALRVPEES